MPPAAFRFFAPSGGGMVGAAGTATPLAVGSSVGPGSSFITSSILANQLGTSYFGFRFLNEASSVTNYGYVVVEQIENPPVAGAVRVLGYAYDNTGAAVTVVPEPSAWVLMLGGVAALGAMRKRLAARHADAR